MKQSDAVRHLEILLRTVQRFRSIMDETGSIVTRDPQPVVLSLTEATASRVWPWVWGEKCIIPALSGILDRFEKSNKLQPQDFYNMIFIATHLEPMLGAGCQLMGDRDFPEQAEIGWFRGWE